MLKNGKITYAVLITIWCVGLLLGIALSAANRPLFGDLLRVVVTKRPSFTALLFRNILPVVLLYVVLLHSGFYMIYPLIFIDALCRGFCAMCVIGFFGSSAWLLRSMVLFSTGCVSIIFWYMLFSFLQGTAKRSAADMIVVAAIPMVATIIDYSFVSPYLLNLSKYF